MRLLRPFAHENGMGSAVGRGGGLVLVIDENANGGLLKANPAWKPRPARRGDPPARQSAGELVLGHGEIFRERLVGERVDLECHRNLLQGSRQA